MDGIRPSVQTYERWLRSQLRGSVVAADLTRKHKKMRASPFAFLRATYWRWAETVLEVCPDLAGGPRVLAVGDIHLENFGTWRDADGRLVWGVNDFNEAAEMPYALDLVRLATSTALSQPARGTAARDSCDALLTGYREGLKAPGPTVLERDHPWLRTLVAVPEDQRTDFWVKIDDARTQAAPPAFRKALAAAMPAGCSAMRTARRTAGAGSLGRPRWVGAAAWHGAPVVREAKALVTSGWDLAHSKGTPVIRCAEIASGRYRAPDPWYAVTGTIVVRRLSPSNRKIEADDPAVQKLSAKVIRAMGRDLASVHLGGTGSRAKSITDHLGRRDEDWLLAASKQMAKAVTRDYDAFR